MSLIRQKSKIFATFLQGGGLIACGDFGRVNDPPLQGMAMAENAPAGKPPGRILWV